MVFQILIITAVLT